MKVGKPAPGPCDPRLARAFITNVPACQCLYMGPHTCGRFDDRVGPGSEPDWDAEWLKPAWDALHEMEARIAADPTYEPDLGPSFDDEDDDEAA